MFGQTKKLTLEEKASIFANEIRASIHLEPNAYAKRAQMLQNQINVALAEKTVVANSPVLQPAQGIQWGNKTLQFGKLYELDGVKFQVWNPAKLSAKQEAVVRSFIRDLYYPLNAPQHMTLENVAPWIDVIFMFNRREISAGMFERITKLNIASASMFSTFDYRHEHNL